MGQIGPCAHICALSGHEPREQRRQWLVAVGIGFRRDDRCDVLLDIHAMRGGNSGEMDAEHAAQLAEGRI